MAKVQNAQGLSGSQVIILNVLAKASMPLSMAEISFAGKGVPVNTNNLGPVSEDSLDTYKDSLRGRGYVKPERWEGDDVRWSITDAGLKMAGMKGRVVGPEKRLPNEVIDPVALAMKKTRTYPFEEYTQEDMLEFRSKLPKQYHDINLDDLRRQAQARRKQGIFSDPDEKRRKAFDRLYREFGPHGTMRKDFLTEEQLGEIYSVLGSGEPQD